MKSVSQQFKNQLLNATAIQTKLRVFGEFNHNRYSEIASITGDDWYPEMVPLASVVESRRPTRGVLKARLASGTAAPRVAAPYSDSQTEVRNYFPSETDTYKYWSSKNLPATNGIFATPQIITVTYKNPIWTNKIIVGFENSAGSPKSWTLEVFEGSWKTVATDATLDGDGQLILWYNGTGWTTAPTYSALSRPTAFRVRVNSMTKQSYLNIIEISPRLETDLSDYAENDFDATYEIGRNSFVAPIGEVSSNTGSISFSNIDNLFTNDNPDSVLFGLVQKNAKITAQVGYKLGSIYEYVTVFTQYVEDWESGEHSITASLKDSSLFMQNENPPQIFLQNVTPGAAIWHMLDVMGYSNYRYDVADDDVSNVIPYYWSDTERTLWENINDLAYGTQTVAYFDEYDVLQIKDGVKLYKTGSPVWNFTATAGSKLPDIESLSYQKGFESNHVEVDYEPIKLSQFDNGAPEMVTLWEAEDPTVLRSTRLVKNLSATETNTFFIPISDVPIWPYEGLVNVESEVIRYSGKEYAFINQRNFFERRFLKSADEKRHVDTVLTKDGMGYRSVYTGRFKIVKRGEFKTPVIEHITNQSRMQVIKTALNAPGITNVNSLYAVNVDGGYGTVTSNTNAWQDIFVTRAVNSNNTVIGGLDLNGRFGGRLRFRNNSNNLSAGVALMGPGGSGLFVGIASSIAAETNRRPTVLAFTRGVNGQYSNTLRISNMPIVAGSWYDIEFNYSAVFNNLLTVFVNGSYQGKINLPFPGGNVRDTYVATWQRGVATVDYDYYFGTNSSDPSVIESVYDPGLKAYRSNVGVERFFVDLQSPGIKSLRRTFFNDFVPVVQEIREFDVKFEDSPVLYSSFYKSNEHQVSKDMYNANAFGAKFILRNTARVNAILQGEDTLTYGEENPVQQKTFIYGRAVGRGASETITAKNTRSIISDGKTSTTFESPWVQTKEYAQKLADWITTQFAGGAVDVQMEVFGNPLIQIGDIATIFYPLKQFNNEKYVVLSVNHSWDSGLKTQVSLRRVAN